MSESREDLERALLGDPFNGELRGRYAEWLLHAEELNAALAQYEILMRQSPEAAPPHVGAARSLLRLGKPSEAARLYVDARKLKGFVADEELESHLATTTRGQGPRLSVVGGGRSGNVVELAVPSQDRTRFDDIAGLEDLKRTIRLQIIEPFLKPGLFAKFKKRAGGGVLLYGPPGCGKTMIARAVATECRAEFVSVGISDILNLYIGESERNLAGMFEKARHSRPCVLFFDEIDALGFARSKARSEHTRQIVNEFLAQLDGFGTDNHDVLILAATNMPWDVDSALKRPGRFSRQVFVPPPDEAARAHIVELKLEGVPHEAIDSRAIAAMTPHFSGADIEGLVELAKDYVLEEHLTQDVDRGVRQEDLRKAAQTATASTLDWLRTARNLVKYAGADDAYSEVGRYLKTHKLA
ncbi:MAG: ATP-binding protein [Proteobacteria bacterium]|nr:ATP-binding protein [Pseudomonadota bacterium]